MPKVRSLTHKGTINHLRNSIFRTKNNPVLIGEPGVGKTSIAEGLAQRIVNRDVPASLIGRLFSLDMGALMAGAKYKGEYEERIKAVLNEVEKSAEDGVGVILFIDELHLIMAGRGAEGGGMDAGNLFKPLLARGKLRYIYFISIVSIWQANIICRCIGATTLSEYRKYIETDAALERRFAQVIINEPSVPETISILRGIREVRNNISLTIKLLIFESLEIRNPPQCTYTRWCIDFRSDIGASILDVAAPPGFCNRFG